MTEGAILLAGCGVFRKEISFLIKKNGWPLDTYFLDSALHINLEKLAQHLLSALARHENRKIIVFYGACHPRMDAMLADAGTFRTVGQNCVEMLLGNKTFTEEMGTGAFFLVEDWAECWDEIVTRTFGENRQMIRDIFHGEQKYILCLRTPCSGDFTEAAEKVSSVVELPLRWRDVSLDRLESVLQAALTRKMWGK